MAIKLAVLKSGEDIIADIKEVVDKDDPTKEIGLVFINPYVVTIHQPEVITLSESIQSTEKTADIVFSKWIPLSKDDEMFVSHDWVVTIVNPHDDILNSYVKKIGVNDGN